MLLSLAPTKESVSNSDKILKHRLLYNSYSKHAATVLEESYFDWQKMHSSLEHTQGKSLLEAARYFH